ncbi:AAA ATPase, partial [Rhizophlyctis rosea]
MVFQDAKAMFRRSSTPSRLIGRQMERETIINFFEKHAMAGKSGALYISGCPGTGKTALVEEVLRDMAQRMDQLDFLVNIMKLNCMTLTEPKTIFVRLLQELKQEARSAKEASKLLEDLFVPSKKQKNQPIYLVVMDELDSLLTRDSDVLYTLFEWSMKPGSRLVLVGIANALDLTERLLPRLTAKNCKPQLLNFNPYEVKEIAAIIKDRLQALQEEEEDDEPDMGEETKGENTSPKKKKSHLIDISTPGGSRFKQSVPLMHPMAIELVARKMAGTGDLRKALDVCRQAIELVETEHRHTNTPVTAPSTPITAPPTPTPHRTNKKTLHEETLIKGAILDFSSAVVDDLDALPKVSVKHIMNATANALGNNSNLNRIKALGVNQKMVLVTLVMMQNAKVGDWSVGKVYESYVTLCHVRRGHLIPVTRLEFNEIVTLL